VSTGSTDRDCSCRTVLVCWCSGTYTVFIEGKGMGIIVRVCMLSFAGLGEGRMKFSSVSLVTGWIACVVLDLGQARGIFC